MAGKTTRIMYVECKSAGDSGPARIGRVSFSKSGRTIRYRGLELIAIGGRGIRGNYMDVTTRIEYWVSGPKKNGEDRHWAGSGPIAIDEDIADEYWRVIRACDPPNNPLISK